MAAHSYGVLRRRSSEWRSFSARVCVMREPSFASIDRQEIPSGEEVHRWASRHVSPAATSGDHVPEPPFLHDLSWDRFIDDRQAPTGKLTHAPNRS